MRNIPTTAVPAHPREDLGTASVSRPSKHSVRAWMQQRQQRREPPPELAQVRRQLDWRMEPARSEQRAFGVVRTDDERPVTGSDNEFSHLGNPV